MSNKNTRKVKARRLRRQRERAMQEFLAFASKRQALITIGSTCGDIDENVDCRCEKLSPLAMYSLKQVIDTYTDCELVPFIEPYGWFMPIGDRPQHSHVDRSEHGLESTLKSAETLKSCTDCPLDYVNLDYDKYNHKFSRGHLEAYRDWALSQLAVIKQNAWLDDKQWDTVRRHVAFSFSPNLEKSRSLVVIKNDASLLISNK